MEGIKVKICGLKTPEEALMLNECRVDYAGIVMFCEKSKRNNSPETAWQILRTLRPEIERVAVVVSPTPEQIGMIEKMGFRIVQIHGELNPEILEKTKMKIWRAYNIGTADEGEIEKSEKITGYVLDGAVPGSGVPFDWNKLKNFDKAGKDFILAGGLSAENVQEAIRILKPDIVDVSSSVEGESGKDKKKIKAFVGKVRDYE